MCGSNEFYAFVFLYRKARFEKDLLNMIWKVNNNEIKLRRPRAPTQNSLAGDKPNGDHSKKKTSKDGELDLLTPVGVLCQFLGNNGGQ